MSTVNVIWNTMSANTTDITNLWTCANATVNDNVYRWKSPRWKFATGTDTLYTWVIADVTTIHNGWNSEEVKKRRREQLEERWGVEELPKLTAEEAKEVELNSEKFLADVLSPDELVMFRAENKVRVESGLEPEVHYIVKRARLARIERYVDGKLVETLGFFACWEELPELDALATRVFDLKHNEAMVLKKSCRAAAPRIGR